MSETQEAVSPSTDREGFLVKPDSPLLKLAIHLVERQKKKQMIIGAICLAPGIGGEPEMDKDSDITIIFICRDIGYAMKRERIDGFMVSEYSIGESRLTENILSKENQNFVKQVASGCLIYSIDPMISIFKHASECVDRQAPPFSLVRLFLRRMALTHALSEIDRKCENETETLYLLSWLICRILESYYILRDIWVPRYVDIVSDLRERDSSMYGYYKSFLLENQIDKRCEIVQEMVDYVLIPAGGCISAEYTILNRIFVRADSVRGS